MILVSAIFIHESDIISGVLGGFHCSSIDSIIILIRVVMLVKRDSIDKKVVVMLVKVMVLIVLML